MNLTNQGLVLPLFTFLLLFRMYLCDWREVAYLRTRLAFQRSYNEIKTFATGEAVDAGRPPPGGRQQRLHLDGISELSHRTKSQEIEDLSMNP